MAGSQAACEKEMERIVAVGLFVGRKKSLQA